MLPTRLRIGSLVAVLVYLLAMVLILEQAGIIDVVASADLTRIGTWIFAALFGIGVVMNAVSRSKSERPMALLSLALGALTLTVALDA